MNEAITATRKQIELLTWLAQHDLTPASPPMSRVPLEALGIAYRFVDDPREWDVLPRVCEYFISRYPTEDNPKSYCKTAILRGIDMKRKSGAPAAQKSWDEDRASYARMDHDDWRYALYANDAAMRRLLAIYAAKMAP